MNGNRTHFLFISCWIRWSRYAKVLSLSPAPSLPRSLSQPRSLAYFYRLSGLPVAVCSLTFSFCQRRLAFKRFLLLRQQIYKRELMRNCFLALRPSTNRMANIRCLRVSSLEMLSFLPKIQRGELLPEDEIIDEARTSTCTGPHMLLCFCLPLIPLSLSLFLSLGDLFLSSLLQHLSS